MSEQPVWSAGTVAIQGAGIRREVALIRRLRYDDWSLPKGKVERDELLPYTAVRETLEESSTIVRLGAPLRPVRYQIPSGPKFVSYWVGTPLHIGKHRPDREVDDVAWVPVDEALQRLTYVDERAVVEEAADLPETTPLMILRHAKAYPRKGWTTDGRSAHGRDDVKRPIDQRGKRQLKYLHQLLYAYGIVDLVSSSALRCRQTLAPFAKREGLVLKPVSLLTEEVGQKNASGVARYVQSLADRVARRRVPAVICSHRPVIPMMVEALGIPARPLPTASCVIAHLDPTGKVVRVEWQESLRVKAV